MRKAKNPGPDRLIPALDTLRSWQQREYTGMKPGLGRIRAFLREAGDPQRRFETVHVAGTNGKGATSLLIARILGASGYRTGLYTSPHLVDITERVQVDERTIPAQRLDALAGEYRQLAERCSLTFFEFITALAFIQFAREKIDVAVLETGLGGRFDATNIIERPLVSVITSIDYDHREILGRRLAEIAFEKAGIVKKGRPVVSGAQRPAARDVIRRACRERGSALFQLGRDFSHTRPSVRWLLRRQEFTFRGIGTRLPVKLSLLGGFQAVNASLALAASELLETQGCTITREGRDRALSEARWPGRFEVRDVTIEGKRRTLVLDGAHNPAAMRTFLLDWRRSPWGTRKQTFIFGMLREKDCRSVVTELAPFAKRVIITAVNSPRAVPQEEMRRIWGRYLPAGSIATAGTVREALRRTQGERLVGITGSLYLAGETLRTLQHQEGRLPHHAETVSGNRSGRDGSKDSGR